MSTRSPKRRDVNEAARLSLAMQLRAQRLTYEEIALRCGYADRTGAYHAIHRELERRTVADVEHLRQEEVEMLNALHASVWDLAMDEENKGRLFAVDRLLTISEARRKLLGLDRKADDVAPGVTLIRQYDAPVEQL